MINHTSIFSVVFLKNVSLKISLNYNEWSVLISIFLISLFKHRDCLNFINIFKKYMWVYGLYIFYFGNKKNNIISESIYKQPN